MTTRYKKMVEMARSISAAQTQLNSKPSTIVVEKPCNLNNASNSNKNGYSETDVFEACVKNETQSNTTAILDHIQISKLNEFYNHNSDEVSIDSFDDSDIDPDFYPSNAGATSDDEISDISELAAAIEKNISCEQSNVYDVSNLPSTSAVNNDSGTHNEWLTKIVKPKSKKGKPKNRICKPLTVCKMKCQNKITYEQQKTIFTKYWDLHSYSLRAVYASGLMEVRAKQKVRLDKSTIAPRNRTLSYVYSLNINGIKTVVCQKCFLRTLGETESFIKTLGKKILSDSCHNTIVDSRGKRNPVNKLSDSQVGGVVDHINKFPAYESHYTRQRSNKKYLQCDLNLITMYKLYSAENESPVSITKYSQIFKGMGLAFKKPKADTCGKCDMFKIQIDAATSVDAKNNIVQMQTDHLNNADLAYKVKNSDKNIANLDSKTKLYTFDLEKCLPTPLLNSNIAFYKRQLWTYNLTVHDCVSNKPFCYMWHEGEANRGGNEVASCLLQHLLMEPTSTEQIIFYSDCCSGQNKNSFVSMMFMLFMQNSTNIKVIDHKFLLPGHTHMECDVDHSVIERKRKKSLVQIHHPREWYQFVRAAGSTHQFQVIAMGQNKFYDFAKMINYTDNFGIIQYKNSLTEEEPFKSLNIRRRGIIMLSLSDLQLCYDKPQIISKEKKKDLIDQLHLVNEMYHNFYLNLNDGNIPNIDPDIEDEEDVELQE